ncbi:NlpC/P60 family protein [uncultured Actinomyces sp.]|uniref:C40 family peptidase n=1 Tax=uncultured Actinomyces sp. TaxID=249061 RepID=UPI00288A7883|nr:NlpC/P60 family protein [uncultured Actinomyces sp.]
MKTSLIAAAPLMLLPLMMAGGDAQGAGTGLEGVPPEYVQAVMDAGSICTEITPSLIAGQIEAESGWDATAVSPAGAQGIAQFMPATWKSNGVDANGDGVADPFDPIDAIASQGRFMCGLVETVKAYVASGQAVGNVVDLALAAYNAGAGAVQQHRGIPPYSETQDYVAKIKKLAGKYTQRSVSASSVVATAQKYLGTPYVWGGTTAAGLDCSGLIVRVYADLDKPLNVRTAHQIITQAGTPVDELALQPGDLIGFATRGSGHYHHIGIYAGKDPSGNRLMIHAPDVGGHVEQVPLDTAYWLGMHWQAVRI